MSEFLFGDGFAISGGDEWRVRRKAVGPSLHKAYLAEMTDRVFGPSAQNLCSKLEVPAPLSCQLHRLCARPAPRFQEGRLLPGVLHENAMLQLPQDEAYSVAYEKRSNIIQCHHVMPCTDAC